MTRIHILLLLPRQLINLASRVLQAPKQETQAEPQTAAAPAADDMEKDERFVVF
jgi:hypothetical protein